MAIQNALSDMMEGEEWKTEAKQLGGFIKALCEMLDALDCEVEMED